MRMARVNVYLPDDMAEAARAAGLNVSGLTQDAIRRTLAGQRTTDWLDTLGDVEIEGVSAEMAANALAAAREEFGAEPRR